MARNDEEVLLREGDNQSRYYAIVKKVELEPLDLKNKLYDCVVKIPELNKLLFNDLDVEDEEGALNKLSEQLKFDDYSCLRRFLHEVVKAPGVISRKRSPDGEFEFPVKERHIVNLTVSILRGEMSVMKDSKVKRGLDVVRIDFRKIRGRDSTGTSRVELHTAPILMETGTNLESDKAVRAYNLVTETVSRSFDKGNNDQTILESTLKRAIKEEVLEPLSDTTKLSSTLEAIEELAEWLAKTPKFITQPGQDQKSSSTGLNSYYNIHTVTIYVPHPQGENFSGLEKNAQRLLKELWKTNGIKRTKEEDTLVWTEATSASGKAPFYWRSKAEKTEMTNIQHEREGDLRISAEGSKPELDFEFNMKHSSKEEWFKLLPNKDLKVSLRTVIHEDDWSKFIKQYTVIKGGINGGLRRPYAPIRAAISVMCAISKHECKDCFAKKGIPCQYVESGLDFYADKHSFNAPRYDLEMYPSRRFKYRYKAHRSRLDDYRGSDERGGDALQKALNYNVRNHKSRRESIVIKRTKLQPGKELKQIKIKSRTKQFTLELEEKVNRKWHPNTNMPDASQNNGWWPSVHIDQSSSDMKKIARAMQSKSYGFAVLRCETGKEEPRALGIISVTHLVALANSLG